MNTEQDYTKLRNGIYVPSDNVLEFSQHTHRLYTDDRMIWTDYLSRLCATAQQNFTPDSLQQFMTKEIMSVLYGQNYDFVPFKARSKFAMARTAVAASMIHVEHIGSEIDSYLVDPIDDTNLILDQLSIRVSS